MQRQSQIPTSQEQAANRLLLFGDVALIAVSVVLAYLLHLGLKEFVPFLKEPPRFTVYAALALMSAPIWLSVIPFLGLHRVFDRTWKRVDMLWGLLKLHIAGLTTLSIILFFLQMPINRSLIVLFLNCTFLLMYAERSIIQLRVRHQHAQGRGRKNILLVGDWSESMKRLVDAARELEMPPLFIGRLGAEDSESRETHDNPERPNRLGSPDSLSEILHQRAVDQVFFLSPLNDPEDAKELLRDCEALGVPACFHVEVKQPLQSVPRILSLYQRPFLVFDLSPNRAGSIAVKHAFDIISSLIIVLLLLPILFLVSVAILISMGRPILFSQARAGLFGREFKMHKFRTMVAGAEKKRDDLLALNEMQGPVFKIARDPRITRLGRFLRRWSIDELPQLFNVLSGDMSLVGPRPLPIMEQQQIRGWKRRRLSMKPGITGLWQVSGRSNVDFEEWMKLDIEYVDKWALSADFRILVRTANAVLRGIGAT